MARLFPGPEREFTTMGALARIYYFWIRSQYRDPVIFTVMDGVYRLHPGGNRWIAAALQGRSIAAEIWADHRLEALPSGTPVTVVSVSQLWPREPDHRSWSQWAGAVRQLEQSLAGRGSLLLTWADRVACLGQGPVRALFEVTDPNAVASVLRDFFQYADSLGWRSLS